ncbi:hypothetical protein [Oscillatoria sp. HE19RPO]|nr:hypothetical protein [Oscillatoria sp. HE19RPO]
MESELSIRRSPNLLQTSVQKTRRLEAWGYTDEARLRGHQE